MEARTGRVNQRKSPISLNPPTTPNKHPSPPIRAFPPPPPHATRTSPPPRKPTACLHPAPTPGYGPLGERLVAGVVALSPSKTQVLLIQATKRTSWVLPKGGWELDEPTASMAACREAWEEAGIVCTVVRDLGKIAEMRAPGESLTGAAPKAEYIFFEVAVDREEREWPEMGKRERRWMGYQEARRALVGRPELMEALERSSIVR